MLAAGAEPAFKGYRGYPATLCASVNDEVVHGIPASRALVAGDIISLDMGVKLNGFFGDSAVTVPVGKVSEDATTLLRVTQESLEKGIAQVKLGGRVSDIGHAIQQHVEAHGFSVVREFVGHGIGAALHEEPQIANYGEPGRGPRLAEGMTLAKKDKITPAMPAGDSDAAAEAAVADSLKSMPKGPAWDKFYIDHNVAGHEKVLRFAQDAANSAQNADLKAMIQKATPTIQKHLDSAKALQTKLAAKP